MGWIIIRNWDRFQHYGDRRSPPWIKLYLALLHDDDFQSLTPADRSALTSLWMLYAMTRRSVRDDTAKISRAIGQRVTKGTLERLNHAGFIDVSASKPLAQEVEVDVEKEKAFRLKAKIHEDLKPSRRTQTPADDLGPTSVEVDEASLELAHGWIARQGTAIDAERRSELRAQLAAGRTGTNET